MKTPQFAKSAPIVSLIIWTSCFASVAFAPPPALAQSAPGAMCLALLAGGRGFQNTCPYVVHYKMCIINPAYPEKRDGIYYLGQPDCARKVYKASKIDAAGSPRDAKIVDPQSLFFGGGVVWLECRSSNGMETIDDGSPVIHTPRPHFLSECHRPDGKVVPGFGAVGQPQDSIRLERGMAYAAGSCL